MGLFEETIEKVMGEWGFDSDQILLERTNLSKGCAMVYYDFPELKDIHSEIDEGDLYDEEGFDLETKPHCTLLYGFTGEPDIKEILDIILDYKIPPLTLENISLFENEKYDVLKFDINSEELTEINGKLRDKFDYENDYDEYSAHSTVAYLKPGRGKKYVEKYKGSAFRVEPKEVVYSAPDGTKTRRKI